MSGFTLFSGSAHPELAEEVARNLNWNLGQSQLLRFSDGEISVEVRQNVRGKHAILLQSVCPPSVNDELMQLIIMADALKRSSANHITAVLPYLGYTRQDRRPMGRRVSISAKAVAKTLEGSGIDHVITMDLHAEQIQGFFEVPTDNIYASPVLIDDIRQQSFHQDDMAVVAPDIGGVGRARAIAKSLRANLVLIDKRRFAPNQSEVVNIIGKTEGKVCILVDDIIDTAGTICNAAKAIRKKGAKAVYAYVVHPVLSGKAIENIEQSDFEEVVVTNTIPLSQRAKMCSKIRQLSVAPLLADVVARICKEDSISHLFEGLRD